jgi:hypothetical protein
MDFDVGDRELGRLPTFCPLPGDLNSVDVTCSCVMNCRVLTDELSVFSTVHLGNRRVREYEMDMRRRKLYQPCVSRRGT